MKREIKFEYGFQSVNGIVKKVYHLHEIPNIKEKCDVFNVLPIVYVRQFTGLKDKNGKEIYEGNFIKRHYDTYQVVWMYSGWRLTKIKNHYMEEFYDCSHFSFTDDEFKIIGNIYENPELL